LKNDFLHASPAGTPSGQPLSVIGNLATLKAGEIVLPPFLVKRAEGLFVDMAKLESATAFLALVERVFYSDAYFWDLDYERFIELLYPSAAPAGHAEAKPIRLAADIVAFLPERRALYKSIKIGNGQAEYFFEPLYMEMPTDGLGEGNSPSQVKAILSFDEFVADMWGKGVHFGIEADAVRAAIHNGKTGRIVVARRREAILGKAAVIQELAKEIHRDDAPKELPNGKLDLGQFKNHFPQIKQGIRLLKKIPLVMGVRGFDISGNPIEPPIPEDFNLAALAGPGTRIEKSDEGEFIVSTQDGFLSFDNQTNQISIAEKIVSHEGVSVRTTGNLCLTGEEYEEHGEIQEKRLVEGNTITAYADVFGTVSSKGGRVLLKSNLIGGMATNRQGDIIVEGFASGAILKTQQGGIVVKRAERCTIVGTQVTVEHAVNCEILADEVTIRKAEGCVIAAKLVKIDSSAPHKHTEMRIYLLTPDMGKLEQKIHALKAKIEEIEPVLAQYNQEIAKIADLPDVKKYRMVAANLKSHAITLNAEQQAGFKKLAASVDHLLKRIVQIQTHSKAIQAERALLAEQIELLVEQGKERGAEVGCTIRQVAGDTFVSTMDCTPETPLNELPPKEINAKLRGGSSAAAGNTLFAGASGAFAWKYKAVGKDS
jgi:uncharacterized coiled-coil protein SlyX